MKSSFAWNAAFWPNFMFIKVRNHLAPNFTREEFRIQVRGALPNISLAVVTPVTRGAHWYLSHQKGIIQGHPGHRYATREALGLCSRIVFRAVFSLDVSTHTIFLYNVSVKYALRGYFLWFFVSMLPTGCYAKQIKSIQFPNLSLVRYMGAQANSKFIANICSLIRTFK